MNRLLSGIVGNEKDFSIQHRIFNAIAFVGVIITLIGSIANYISGLDIYTYLLPLLSFFVFVGLFLYSLLKRNFYIVSRVTYLYIILIFFPSF